MNCLVDASTDNCNHEWCVTSPADWVETCRKCHKSQPCLPDCFNGVPPEWWKRAEAKTDNS